MRVHTLVPRVLFLGAAMVAATAVVSAIRVEIDDSVPAPNARAGSPANVIIDDYRLDRIAQGTDPLENPSGVITKFGFLNDGGPTKTEPDQNTYLEVPGGLPGPTPNFDYGRRYLFQGHENGGGLAYVTRINLDVHDPAHRITLLTPTNGAGLTGFSSIDGSVWDPFTRTLLFTQENNTTNGVIEITPGWPPARRTFEGVIGRGGFEGIHPDADGDLIIAEDVSGAAVNVVPNNAASPKTAHQPNSFIYKFHPYDRTNLAAGGTLYALQVWVNGAAITFHAGDPVGDTFAPVQVALHAPGAHHGAVWVQVHDTAANGSAAFDANARAKAAGATPFKRPENLAFQPDADLETFYFTVTGDTDADAGNQAALATRGSWGAIFRVHFDRHSALGTITDVVLGDAVHASFDNITFADRCTLLTAEDRGDGLHGQLNTLDSVWAYRVCEKDGDHDRDDRWFARRLIALGRDPLATSEDNEPTGLLVSDGDRSIGGLLDRTLNPETTRWFVTQQHGMNQVFEIKFAEGRGHHDR
ncbi:MAG TPA: alkaline phosphatase PhoX [Vicinamibacterales bacterium]|nr:alkaline phosphatase PhoX [Vicinamibacterales bacterium]